MALLGNDSKEPQHQRAYGETEAETTTAVKHTNAVFV